MLGVNNILEKMTIYKDKSYSYEFYVMSWLEITATFSSISASWMRSGLNIRTSHGLTTSTTHEWSLSDTYHDGWRVPERNQPWNLNKRRYVCV